MPRAVSAGLEASGAGGAGLVSVASNDLAAELAPTGEGTAMGLFNAAASAFGAVAGGAVMQV